MELTKRGVIQQVTSEPQGKLCRLPHEKHDYTFFGSFCQKIMLACCFLLQIKNKERSLHVASDSQCPEEIRYDWVSAFCVISDPGRASFLSEAIALSSQQSLGKQDYG